MTAVDQPTTHVAPARPYPARYQPKGSFIYKLITTTDHKLIGMMYITACFAFFLIGVTLLGIGSAFWGIVGGAIAHLLLSLPRRTTEA